jgi:hypothetical protein
MSTAWWPTSRRTTGSTPPTTPTTTSSPPWATPHAASLKNVQIEALKRRDRLVPRLEAYAAQNGYTFTRTLGIADRSFEMSVLDAPWAFRQYSASGRLRGGPGRQRILRVLHRPGPGLLHPVLLPGGHPARLARAKFAHLRGLLRYPGLYQANSSIPAELRSRHDPKPMLDVDHWVRKQSSRMMFIYGQNDPWSAERFAPTRKDSYLYVAPGANHGAGSTPPPTRLRVRVRDLPPPAPAVDSERARRRPGRTPASPTRRDQDLRRDGHPPPPMDTTTSARYSLRPEIRRPVVR